MSPLHLAIEIFFIPVGVFAVWAVYDSLRKFFR